MERSKRYLALLIVALTIPVVILVATTCGGGGDTVPTPTTAASPTPSAQEEPTATSTTAPTPTATPPVAEGSTPTPSPIENDLIAKGREIFQVTAGDVGCQACHGRDAKGLIGPDIRGATASRIALALSNVEQMAFIKLSPGDVQAVAAYLEYIVTYPEGE